MTTSRFESVLAVLLTSDRPVAAKTIVENSRMWELRSIELLLQEGNEKVGLDRFYSAVAACLPKGIKTRLGGELRTSANKVEGGSPLTRKAFTISLPHNSELHRRVDGLVLFVDTKDDPVLDALRVGDRALWRGQTFSIRHVVSSKDCIGLTVDLIKFDPDYAADLPEEHLRTIVLKVACPTCKVEAGKDCVIADNGDCRKGERLGTSHGKRRRFAFLTARGEGWPEVEKIDDGIGGHGGYDWPKS